MRGTVIAFDESKGYGGIRATGGEEYFFHCTQIEDGTRRIDIGAEVTFDVIPGHRGRYEAAAIRRASS